MEKSPKLFLSILFLLLIISCRDKEEDPLAILEYGKNYQGSSRSLNALKKVTELDSTNSEAYRELSIPYLKRGMPHLWKTHMDKSIELNAQEWQGYRGYNYLWFYRDYKNAIADFNALDTITPNFIDAPQGHSVDYWRGIAYLGLKDYKNSIRYFDKYIEKETKDTGEDWVEVTAFLYEGIAHYENKNDPLALLSFDKLLKYTNNNYADGNYYKALILEKQGNTAEALNLVNLAITNYKEGYYNYRAYVEALRQIYIEDLLLLKKRLTKKQ